jgi:peptide/nickel transport system substrate-binding protein
MTALSSRREFLRVSGLSSVGALLALSAIGSTTLAGVTQAAAQSGGEMTIIKAISGDAQTIDPRLNFQPRASEMVANMYDQLVAYKIVQNNQGQLVADSTQPVPLLAESWEVSPDGLDWTFHLRKDAKFHSGNPITAADAKWSFERGDQIQKDGWFDMQVIALDDRKNGHTVSDAINVIDDNTFTMHVQRRTPYFLQVLSNAGVTIYDSELMKQNATDDDPWAANFLKDHDAGSGPFMLDSIEPGVQIVMNRFDGYFQGPAPASQLLFKVIPSAADRSLLLQNGSVHFAEELTLDTVQQLTNAPQVQVVSYPSTDQLLLMMNTTVGPMQDQKVRQAVSSAVPYDQIAQNVYFGYAQAGGGPIPMGMPTYDQRAPFYTTDMAKAKAALGSSGSPNGFPVTLTIDASRPQWEAAALLIQNALAPMGITVNIDKLAPANFNDQFFTGQLPFFTFQALSWVNDPTYLLQLLWETGSYGNKVNYSDPQLDTLAMQAKTTSDDQARADIFKKIQALMLQDAPAAWLVQPNFVLASSKSVTGYVQRIDQLNRYYYVSLSS